jgi:hypothetical protein
MQGAAFLPAAGKSAVQKRPTLQEREEQMRHRALAALRDPWRPYLFRGTPEDYARSYGLLKTIADCHSVSALVDVYHRMENDGCLFEEAVERQLGMNFEAWQEEARTCLGKQ